MAEADSREEAIGCLTTWIGISGLVVLAVFVGGGLKTGTIALAIWIAYWAIGLALWGPTKSLVNNIGDDWGFGGGAFGVVFWIVVFPVLLGVFILRAILDVALPPSGE